MFKVYIVTTYTGTYLSCAIKKIMKVKYTHISISLDKQLEPMYSFGRLHPRIAVWGGFVEESIHKGLFSLKPKTICKIYSLNVTKEQYEKVKENIEYVKENRKKYSYDYKVLTYIFNDKLKKNKYRYVCSSFVADMLKLSEINIINKESHKVDPTDFCDINELNVEYEGLLSEYNK